jgi:5-(carboxyamino)imidazole ribonucleotide mutase
LLSFSSGELAERLRVAMAAFQEDLQGQADGKGERLRAQTSARPTVGFSV